MAKIQAKSDRKANGKRSNQSEKQNNEDDDPEMTICDIMGSWGFYQWSICLFATIYSGIAGIMVVSGPILTPAMEHYCAIDGDELFMAQMRNMSRITDANLEWATDKTINFNRHPRECFKKVDLFSTDAIDNEGARQVQQNLTIQCSKFVYNDENYGKLLTNSFDLVCDRAWMTSFLSSSALLGMLVSSVTLGLVSDKFGRLRCTQVGFYMGLVATIVAIFSHNYLLLNVCVFIMSYSQIGAANALCTLLMESTSPKLRIVAIFEYGIGWGLGSFLVPVINNLTKDYRLFLLVLVIAQLLLIPWLHWGVHESIRWLLSEGYVNRAQIELRRACRINGVKTDAGLAQNIAHIQVQQVRRVSRIIDRDEAPAKLARALDSQVDEAAKELETLNAIIKQSFNFDTDSISSDAADRRRPSTLSTSNNNDQQLLQNYDNKPRRSIVPVHLSNAGSAKEADMSKLELVSPTLARNSFSVSVNPPADAAAAAELDAELIRSSQPEMASDHNQMHVQMARSRASSLLVPGQLNTIDQAELELARRGSLSTQGLVQLAMKYSKRVEQQEDGGFFLCRMFNAKLWRETLTLTLTSIMLETSYYGFIQANKFVGNNVDLNYMIGAAGEWASAVVSTGFMLVLSRRSALILPMLAASLACIGMALSYHLLTSPLATTLIADDPLDPVMSTIIGVELDTPTSGANSSDWAAMDNSDKSSFGTDNRSVDELRHEINLLLMNIGKFAVCIGIQVAATMAIEAYPSNLRQTAPGAILVIGRTMSVIAPFLFNDTSDSKWVFKSTLVAMAAVGLVVCLIAPFTLRDNKNKELRDHMDEI